MSPPADRPQRVAEERFIGYLQSLAPRQAGTDPQESVHRAALATLRRGLGKPPGSVVEMYRYIGALLPEDINPWRERAYFLVAALFALHPVHVPDREGGRPYNLGVSFRRLRQSEGASESVEKRFVALLDAPGEALPDHLRQAISLLRAREIPVNYARLLRDIQRWQREDRAVQREWARSYWGQAADGAPMAEVTKPAATTEE